MIILHVNIFDINIYKESCYISIAQGYLSFMINYSTINHDKINILISLNLEHLYSIYNYIFKIKGSLAYTKNTYWKLKHSH